MIGSKEQRKKLVCMAKMALEANRNSDVVEFLTAAFKIDEDYATQEEGFIL